MSKQSSGGGGGGGFQSMNLSPPVFAGIKKLGYRTPTPVQRKSLPILLTGTDACVMARTGSGKTVAFLAPVLERLVASRGEGGASGTSATGAVKTSAYAVILSPTRELSLQTLRVLKTLGHYCVQNYGFNFVGINGGESMEKQFQLLSSQPDVVVATPGRLAHHLGEIPDFHLRQCELVVFDEADRLFEMGFAMQLRQICSSMPENRQTMLFSATMPKALVEFTKTGMMHDPTVVRLDSEVQVSEELRIGFVTCRSAEKDAVLLHLVRDVLPTMKGVEGEGEECEAEIADGELSQKDKKKAKKKKKKQERSKHVGKHSKRGLTLIFAATRHHVEYLTLLLTTSGLRATQIYGNMDQVARQHNLASFQNGTCPILVVTDVAARGIDIPLIDHVIHYAFPPSAKLFVHRSGRAARAGRIGYCWGIVDPEEMPYMVDLHVFLGRKMSTGREAAEGGDGSEEKDEIHGEEPSEGANTDDSKREEDIAYTLDEMTPEMVHYGSVPESILVEEVENVRRIVDSELAGSHDAEMLKMLGRVCNNAMKQYRRSRPEASRVGVRRAKALLEGEKETGTGRRVLNSHGGIPPHPVLRLLEVQKVKAALGGQGNDGSEMSAAQLQQHEDMAKKKISDLQKRQDFLRAMANFRPKETVFEAFATGGQKDYIHSSQVDKGANGSAAALVAMKSMRRQMKIARDKGGSLVVAGTESALRLNGEMEEEEADEGHAETTEQLGTEDREQPLDDGKIKTFALTANENVDSKRRLSKAERRKMKKDPNYKPESNDEDTSKKAKGKRGADFRDNLHFIENDVTHDTAAAARSRQIEAAMQPSSSTSSKGSTALAYRIEENMLDIVGDENSDLVKKQRMMRWDKSKRKYIQTTVGEELSGDSKSKKIRLESGQLVKSDKAKLGELYEKWQKKTNRSIGRVGVFDDVTEDAHPGGSGLAGKSQKGAGKKRNGKVDDEMKSATAIRKEREQKEKNNLKNMKKADRRKIESKQRAEKMTMSDAKGPLKKGQKTKKGVSGKWKNSHKKGGKKR